jgi:hypothetical protein
MEGPYLWIRLSPKALVETVMVIVIVNLAMIVDVTMAVVADVHRVVVVVVVVGIASSVGNLVILLESAHLGMVGEEEIDMVVEMIGMVVGVAMDQTAMDQTVVVTDTLAAVVMVTAAMEVVTDTAVTDLVRTDGLDLKKYVPSRYGSLIY